MKTLNLKHKTHFLWMAMCILLLVFTGCSKDDPLADGDDNETTEAIIGKWNLEKTTYQETPGDSDTYPGRTGEWIEFKKGGKGSTRTHAEGDSFEEWSFTWTVNGAKLIIKENGDDGDELTIVRLTGQELVFKEEDTYKNDAGQTIKWVETYYLKK